MFKKLFGSDSSDINLSTKQFKSKMQEPDIIVIDVRTNEEYQSGHLKKAINIDFYEDFEEKVNELDKSKKYLLYCRSGSRSYSAVKMMKNSGFNDVSHLEEGILGWDQSLTLED